MPNKKIKHFYAIIRIDEFHGNKVPLSDKIKIVKIVKDLNEAENEVSRLSKVNSGKGCMYFYQSARFEVFEK